MSEAHTSSASECPYCGGHDFTGVESRRAERIVERCDGCQRHSTRQGGRRYPHDRPLDPDSAYATRVRYT